MAENLTQSPMYNLSLSDKELFHSNFLAWLGINDDTKPFFLKVIKKLSGIDLKQYNKQYNNWTVLREYKNFDLCIKKDNDYILVIENKVKSIPRKDQLDKYVKKIDDLKGNKENTNDTKFLLLTLVDEFPHKDDINKENKEKGGCWQIKTYNDLANIMDMDKNKSLVKDSYFKLLLNDYKVFIENMNALAGIWLSDTNKEAFAKTFDFKGLEKLSDLYTKIQFSSYCVKLQDLIKGIGNNVEVYDSKSIQNNPTPTKLYIKVDWEFASRGHEGFVDVLIPVEDLKNPTLKYGCTNADYYIKVQVQGNMYKHGISANHKRLGKDGLQGFGTNPEYVNIFNKLKWFAPDPSDKNCILHFGKDKIFDKEIHPTSKKGLKNNAWPFTSYRNNQEKKIDIIYQGKKIKKDTKVDDVLNNIVDDIKNLLENTRK